MSFLYNLIILPIYNLMGVLYDYLYGTLHHMGWTIFLMSMVTSVLCLPIYLKSEEFQSEERKVWQKLKDKVDLIKRNYRGNERHMLLQTYYRQQHYNPLMRLRSSLGLLLQIPFFVAAYVFFKDTGVLNGKSIGFIRNLAQPDALFSVKSVTINVLPIAMMMTNIVTYFLTPKVKGWAANLSPLMIRIVFLILLYDAPAGLVLYWLFNNVFTLFKTIILKWMSPRNLMKFSVIALFVVYCVLGQMKGHSSNVLYLISLVLLSLKKEFIQRIYDNFLSYQKVYIWSMLVSFLLIGAYIPAGVVSSSPLEFIEEKISPLNLLFYNMTIYAGIFLFWGWVFYYCSNIQARKTLSILSVLMLAYFVCGLLFIKMPNVPLNTDFSFEKATFTQTFIQNLMYYGAFAVLSLGILILLFFKKGRVINWALRPIGLALLLLASYNIIITKGVVSSYASADRQAQSDRKYVHFSKDGKNVLIIFLDRFIGSYVPIAFEEDKNLYQQFDGFTYFPKTLSYSAHTILGYPPILGGYEYTPRMMDSVPGSFNDKFKQAVTMLPAIFSESGWNSTVINPLDLSWQHYVKWGKISVKDAKKFSSMALYKKYHINYQNMPTHVPENLMEQKNLGQGKMNVFFYSLLPVLSPDQRSFIYNNGDYHLNSARKRLFSVVINSYKELSSLDQITDSNSDKNSFVVINNSLPHIGSIFSYPNYDLNPISDTTYRNNLMPNANSITIKNYHVCMASLKLVGKYLDFLKQNGLYDNTRIMVVADHGAPTQNKNSETLFPFNPHNPVLLFKDYNQKGVLIRNENLMSNADVPLMVTQKLIKDPKNPHTGNRLSDMKKLEGKEKKGIIMKEPGDWKPTNYLNQEKTMTKKDKYYYVKGDPMNMKNWKDRLSYDEAMKLLQSE